MRMVGLTGGIGSGKSTVSRLLADRGAVVIDADQVARDLQAAGSPMVAEMAEAFGSEVVDDDGNLDRAAVAALVFGESDAAMANLKRLNAITHPAIHTEIERRIDELRATDSVVVLDHPLLADHPRDDLDDLVVVDMPVDVQVERLVEGRGMDATDARNRIASQIGRDERLALATAVIDNAGDLAALEAQVDDLWADLAER